MLIVLFPVTFSLVLALQAMKPQTKFSTLQPTESSVVEQGNADNPFGVRLRKTSVLHRFSSEEENTEVITMTLL